ncbi:MAG: acyl-CoA dehydratase activase-related protein [Puniceicoccales bacterium]|jgi:predicted CoA-substrate-specific enzyme activase|nr:acyl-CoA dehydratase activase-related protein [Puniceicoccales bacterium]
MSSEILLHAGLDAGSTTLKLVVTEASCARVLFSDYRRHHADIRATLRAMFERAVAVLGADAVPGLVVTGSAGLGLAEAYSLPFIQETVAAAAMASALHPDVRTLVDIGGEDAKMIFFEAGRAPDIRMNGSCAGGTGAFIDQIAGLLGCDVTELDALARRAGALHPVASRCGVFAKTDIQNLLSRNVSPADIAASAFYAVAQQLVSSLARGRDIAAPVLFCGGPLAHLPTLREACVRAMGIEPSGCLVPENAALVPALGCALAPARERSTATLGELLEGFSVATRIPAGAAGRLPPLFRDDAEYRAWCGVKAARVLPRTALADLQGDDCWLGIDSGSTTTKIVALDERAGVLFTFYGPNSGDPLGAVRRGLRQFYDEALAAGRPGLRVRRAAVTGYGEDLIKAAFGFDMGIVETLAHYRAARSLEPDVSFLLDIGGQDMKAVFIEHGAITRLDINEACSSGCGSFIDGFARSLQLGAGEFAGIACEAQAPCDLGTRCTVFMNSKVKQSLRENATRADIAGGLAYSVAKNCLFKVLKLKDVAELGRHVVVQGGTMRNHAVVRAFELLTGLDITVAPTPEVMGAYGAALHALETVAVAATQERQLAALVEPLPHEADDVVCPGCENRCLVRKHIFANGNAFFAGNKCEKVFANRGASAVKGTNFHAFKLKLLFGRVHGGTTVAAPVLTIGIPRVLNFYENFPFWHTLLVQCGMAVTLSAPSTFKLYGNGVRSIMSDNICFPAKIVHGHVQDLVAKKTDRILMPFVVHEQRSEGAGARNYNCPIVSGYSDVIRSAMDTAGRHGIPLDSPVLTFADTVLLERACRQYCVETLGVAARVFDTAFAQALKEQKAFDLQLTAEAHAIAGRNEGSGGRPLIVLGGRPYHVDPLIQHKISDMFSGFGADVISEDIARGEEALAASADISSHWAYPGRILAAAAWVAASPAHVHFVQITSFGCGPDAFITDEVASILRRAGKSHTVLKVDDINNPGSLLLRARSLIESLARRSGRPGEKDVCGTPSAQPALRNARFTIADRRRTILVPFFCEAYSPFIPVLFELMGYKAHTLPPANEESINHGLRYANNEICYPATLVIGDFVRALKTGDYHRNEVALGITQTGGQCRASNYLSLIKRALAAAGYADVPVISVGTVAGAAVNDQPGFKPDWLRNIHGLVAGMFYADHLLQMYHATAPVEAVRGTAAALRDRYVSAGAACVLRRDLAALHGLLRAAVTEFNALAGESAIPPRVGIVGEIYVKYNFAGNRNIVEWLVTQGVEPVVPPLADFFLQEFPNRGFNRRANLERSGWFSALGDKVVFRLIEHWQTQFEKAASGFVRYHRGEDVFVKAGKAGRIVNPAAQYGEGWLISAEMAAFAERGINNVVSLQPFGCIANHLVAKGIERRMCQLYPKLNLLFLDLDSGTSEANLLNRLHFIVQNARDEVRLSKESVHVA